MGPSTSLLIVLLSSVYGQSATEDVKKNLISSPLNCNCSCPSNATGSDGLVQDLPTEFYRTGGTIGVSQRDSVDSGSCLEKCEAYGENCYPQRGAVTQNQQGTTPSSLGTVERPSRNESNPRQPEGEAENPDPDGQGARQSSTTDNQLAAIRKEETDEAPMKGLAPPNCGSFAPPPMPKPTFKRRKPKLQIGLQNEYRHVVVGGQRSVSGKWPWLVALGYTSPITQDRVYWKCSAVLVTPRSSITAAHCLEHPPLKLSHARFGDVDLYFENDGALPVTMEVSHAVKHPNYTHNLHNSTNDIAIIFIKSPLTFTSMISPICLPVDVSLESNPSQKAYSIAGWGATQYGFSSSGLLWETNISLVPNEECYSAFQRLNVVITENHICAGGPTGDACTGDSGGPLMIQSNDRFYTVGVISFGKGCANPDYPGVYTRVSPYLSWMKQNLI